eukprot:Skav221289  [mRNA]  locus=scaffold2775:254644:259185:- [translate_table: standard]
MASTLGKLDILLHQRLGATTFAGGITVAGGSEVVVHVASRFACHVAKCTSITVINPVIRTIEATVHIHADDAKGLVLLHPAATRGPLRTVELFGGLGGWSHAATHANSHPVAIIDVDAKVCQATAKTFGTSVLSVDDFLEHALSRCESNETLPTIVVQGKVDDPRFWVAISLLNVSVALASPPCQPWSSTGRQSGLAAFDGLVFTSMLDLAAAAKLHALVCENVVGFPNHPDYHEVLAHSAFRGLKLVSGGLVPCQKMLPVIRNRWLGVFIHVSIPLETELLKNIQQYVMPAITCAYPATGPTLREADAIHTNMTATERDLLQVSQEAVSMLRRFELCPQWLVDEVDSNSSEPMLQARLLTPDNKLSGVMARYGGQHLLPLDLLKEKGLHTMLFGSLEDYRYFSPWEILASMGFPPHTRISACVAQAFQQTGNALSPIHAGFAIMKAHVLLGKLSPFDITVSLQDFLHAILNEGIKLSKVSAFVDGDLCCLRMRIVEVPNETRFEPRSKRSKTDDITPTVAFTVEQQMEGTRESSFSPVFEFPNNEGLCLPTVAANGGIIILKHSQKHWLILVHGDPEEQLSCLIQRAMPHAREEHFFRFHDGPNVLSWEQNIQCVPCKEVVFAPITIPFTCEVAQGPLLAINGDVTWTIATLKTYVAAALRCNCDSLKILSHELPTFDTDYLAEYESCHFVSKFKACMPRYFSFAPRDTTVEMDLTPKSPNCIRFVAKHPLRKVVRSIVVAEDADAGTVIRTLFPDVCEQASWTITCGGQSIGPLHPIAEMHSMAIDWHCFRPLVPTVVDRVMLHSSIDSSALQVQHALSPQRWIKSPSQTRASVCRVDPTLDIKQIAGAYVVHTQMAINMTCHLGGHVVDPDTVISNIPVDQVLCFKIAPLLGGGKSNIEQLRTKVRSVLETHGVPADASADRANAFLNKADHETLFKVLTGDETSLWNAIKDEANRVHFRLVYRQEMKTAKHNGRSKPPSKHVKGGKDKAYQKPRDDFVATASNIKIDIDHFWDGEDKIALLDAARFGQDQSGLAIMSRFEADKHDDSQTLSMDALAILIVGKNFAATDETFEMPAYTNGGQPIIIQAALRQYGDRPVTFRAAIPMTEVGQTASTTLELTILKSEVMSWKECGVPLHYLGVQISALRGSSLISAWALRTFSADRKPVPMKEAVSWHGYVKVEDAILDQVLARSGWAGIYVTPRTPDRKLDDRYTAIVVPGCTLNDMQKKAGSLEKALGIVRIKDQLAIRCRREHAQAIRATLLPESAFVASNAFDSQDTLWLLKNVPCEIGQNGLAQALEKANWDAKPIRAQGQNRWLIASKVAPPSMHMCINQTHVLIEPAKRAHDQGTVTMVAKQFKVDTVATSSNGVTQIATTSRFQEIKTEMTEQMEARLLDANRRIEQLQHALGQVQQAQVSQVAANQATQAELAQLKEEQAFARQKIGEVENSIVQSGQTVIQTMQDMMQNMQSSLEASMKQIVGNETWSESEKEKRARTHGTPPKLDQFACRS